MPGFGEFLGKTGEAAWQLFVWQIGAQVVSQLLGPYLTELGYLVNDEHPDIILPVGDLVSGVLRGQITHDSAVSDARKLGIDEARFNQLVETARPRLSPADLAQLVIRGFMTDQAAIQEAAFSGVDQDRLYLLEKIAADAPGPSDLATALRRGVIPEDDPSEDVPSFAGGIREGRLANKWIPMVKALATYWPSPIDALSAELEGQLDHDTALAMYEKLGGDPQFYTWLFNSRGNAPTPGEGLEMLNRGIIPERGTGPQSTSYEQLFLEGPWRNKWLPAFLALRTYVTPPRSVVAMIRDGSLTDAQAAAELAKQGMDETMIGAYIAEGHQQTAAPDKNLTQSQIVELYTDRIVSQTEAHDLLTALNYSDQNATFLLTLADLRRSMTAVSNAVSRVHTLYVGHKITRAATVDVLTKLEVPADQVADIIATWDLEASVNVKQLTEAQIVAAWDKEIIDLDTAMAELQTIGYTALDAWVLLSTKNNQPLPNKPAQGPNPVSTVP